MALSKWRCDVCGYIHEGPEPPAICPVCGVGPELFSLVEEEPAPVALDQQAEGKHIVIIGGGIAGLRAAEYARKGDDTAQITLVHKERMLPYNRLNLTPLLAGEVEEGQLLLHDASWYKAQRIETLEGEVVRIDRDAATLFLRDGSSLAFHRLVLASGAQPFVPPLAGVERAGVLSLRTLDDVQRILALAPRGARCVCIGGGLLGLEAAGALNKRGVSVTVVEGAPWLLPRQLAEPAAAVLAGELDKLGI
ncbi:MAG: FAD-dependent oxidoreductase, partial [Deltaproteobacteria bacterium]|nr:FAD-dependent oxidoreductase [Deltaproteobacteria bacterium]